MPSMDHELVVELLRRSPSIVAQLVSAVTGLEVDGASLTLRAETFAQLEPTSYVADVVLESPSLTLVLECQASRDVRKRRSWPLYTASAHAATGRQTLLVVVALDPKVAAWARRPIRTFHDGTFRPIVIGAADIPRLTDLDAAKARPELAVLSALAHGREEDALAVGLAGWMAASTVASVDEDRGKLYADAVLAALTATDARALLEVVMKTEGYQYKSEWMRKNFAEGKAEGKLEALREVVRSLCEALGVGWDASREDVVASLSVDDLERLVVRLGRERRWPDDA